MVIFWTLGSFRKAPVEVRKIFGFEIGVGGVVG